MSFVNNKNKPFNPAPTEMWRNESRIVSNGNFVMLVAHTGADAVVEQFNALFA